MIKIAINGLGRIGKAALKNILDSHSDLEVVAINDLADAKTLAHLLRYDSVYGIYNKIVKAIDHSILIDGTSSGINIKILNERNPEKLPWKELGIDIVLECTGVFRDYENAKKHLSAGAKKVIISAPSRDPEKIPCFILGINEDKFDSKKHDIVDMASCTTNCLAPIAKVLNDNFKIVKGFMTTIHSYTADQKILDSPHRDLRRARAAAINIVPTTTGATKAIENVIPELKGKLDGLAFRVPTPAVSLLDFVCEIGEKTTAQDLNYIFKKASQTERLKGILGIEDAPLVSTDYIKNSFSTIIDSSLTKAKDNLVKIVAWYDNEYGYASRLAEFAEFVGKNI